MRNEHALLGDPRIKEAVEELRTLIASRYPDAEFEVFVRDDLSDEPKGLRLRAMVDVEDLDEVMDTVIDALYDIEVERGLPVYVVMVQPHSRVMEELRARGQCRQPADPASATLTENPRCSG